MGTGSPGRPPRLSHGSCELCGNVSSTAPVSRAQRGTPSYSVSNVGHQHVACLTRETSILRAQRGTLAWDINLSRAHRWTPACVPNAGHQHVACPTRDTNVMRAQRGTPTSCVPNVGHQPVACPARDTQPVACPTWDINLLRAQRGTPTSGVLLAVRVPAWAYGRWAEY